LVDISIYHSFSPSKKGKQSGTDAFRFGFIIFFLVDFKKMIIFAAEN